MSADSASADSARPATTLPATRLPLHPQKRLLAWLNVLGGSAVLASYAHGLATHPEARGAVWGGVPESLQPLYTVCMLLATAGYFAFTGFVFLRLDAERVRIAGRLGFGIFNLLYAAILIPSALWMPLTFAMLEAPSALLWGAIRGVLAVVGVGSVGLMVALATVQPREPTRSHRLALVGSLPFCIQTAVLDAVVWPAYFPV